MHLYFISRGIKNKVDEMVNDLQAQHFQQESADQKTGLKRISAVQGALRPIQLWEYVFPKESLDVVLKTLALPRDYSKGHPYHGFKPHEFAFRKLLGAKPIPIPNEKILPRIIRKEHVSIMGIGIRDDEIGAIPEDSDNPIQEKL